VGFQQFVLGALGATLAWMITEFVARPFRQFFDLRRETARRLVEFDNVRARAKMSGGDHRQVVEISDEEEKRLRDAEKMFRDLAAQMRGFAVGERFAAETVKIFGFDSMETSRALIGYSNEIGTYGQGRADFKDRIRKLLRLQEDAGQ
jgi:hypothetical protein